MDSRSTTRARASVARFGVFALALALVVAGLAVTPASGASAQPVTVTTATELDRAFDDGDDVVLGADITIDETGPDIAVADGADITLDLNGWTLDVTNDGDDPAIGVPENTSLTIDDTAGGGELHATAKGQTSGGIGTGPSGGIGDITINDGTVAATSEGNGAGIGTGRLGDRGDITINGGDVTATSKDRGAGIGTGHLGHCGDITINDGTITATSRLDGAGIGAGRAGDSGDITINGGDVTATNRLHGAGIGTGYVADSGDITINDGTITATSGELGAGIGAGYRGTGGEITINGGDVTATNTVDGPGIGIGLEGVVGDVSVGSAAMVEVSSEHGPAIGPDVGGDDFGSLSNAGTLIVPAGNHIEVPDGIIVANSGLITGAGELRGDGEIDNSGSIWHSVDVEVDVTDHDYELAFDANGGTGGPTGTIRVYAATLADAGLTVPTDEPTLAGSSFTGWADAPTGGTGPLDETSVLSDQPADRDEPVSVTWYADWTSPQIDTTDLPDGQVDDDYDATLEGSGGVGDLTWAITDGALPDGLDLDPDDGTITGTPTEDGTFDFTVTATDDDGNTDTADLAITIEPADEAPGNGNGDEPGDGNGDEPGDGNGNGNGNGEETGGEQPPTGSQPTTGGPLPRTGAPIAPMTAGGLAAVALGALLVGTRRRRHGML